jgi:hypothetical protein
MLVKLTSLKLMGPGIPLGAAENMHNNYYGEQQLTCMIICPYTPEGKVSAVIVPILDPTTLMALTVIV